MTKTVAWVQVKVSQNANEYPPVPSVYMHVSTLLLSRHDGKDNGLTMRSYRGSERTGRHKLRRITNKTRYPAAALRT